MKRHILLVLEIVYTIYVAVVRPLSLLYVEFPRLFIIIIHKREKEKKREKEQ